MTRIEVQMAADWTTVRSGDESNGNAAPGMIDPVTIQRAYAANVDALKVMDELIAAAGEVGGQAQGPGGTRR